MPPNEGFYKTNANAENALKLLFQAGTGAQLFFLILPFAAPDWPFHANQEDIDKYRGKSMKGWDALRKDYYDRIVSMELILDNWSLSQ